MIVDTSALAAILRDEPDAASYSTALATTPARLSAASYLECGIVIDSQRDPIASRGLDELIRAAGITIEPVTEHHAILARRAYQDFGRGSGHPARLNFGDCFTYALAVETGEPLLFKGDDFAATGIAAAIIE